MMEKGLPMAGSFEGKQPNLTLDDLYRNIEGRFHLWLIEGITPFLRQRYQFLMKWSSL